MQDRITNDGRLVTGSLQPTADTWERAPHVPLTAPSVPPISNEVPGSLNKISVPYMLTHCMSIARCAHHNSSISIDAVAALQALERLADFLQAASNVTVLTGAGVSTGRRSSLSHRPWLTCDHDIEPVRTLLAVSKALLLLMQSPTFQTIEALAAHTRPASSR
jgi:hypothetical protein